MAVTFGVWLTRWVDQRVAVFGAAVGDRVVQRAGMDQFLTQLADQFGAFLLGLNDQMTTTEKEQ